MFPYGYQVPFTPGFYQAPINMGVNGLGTNAIRGATGILNGARGATGVMGSTNGGGIFSKLFGLKGINWGGLLNNTSKTLGVINQAVPLVKQVGPMFNNMKSMLKVASLFKDETDTSTRKANSNTNNNINNTNTNTSINNNINNNNTNTSAEELDNKKTSLNTSQPNFFI